MSTAVVENLVKRTPYYGWVIVGTFSLTETVSWGILYYAFSVFLVPMQTELGWSAATLTAGYSLALLLSGLAAPFVGRWLDLHGSRALMTVGSALGSVLVVAWSQVESLASYYLIWAGIGIAMSATLYEPAFTTVTAWFERDRPRALLAVTIFAGFASTIFLPFSSWLETRYAWRDALLILAVILASLTILPHALLLRRRPEDLGLNPDGRESTESHRDRTNSTLPTGVDLREALRDRTFWWLAIAFALINFSTIAVAVHLIPYLTERGDGVRFAAAATGLIGAAQVSSRIIATAIGSRLSPIALTGAVFALQAIAIAVLLVWQTRTGVLTAVLMLGAGRGVVTLMRPGLVALFYGRANFGAINGTLVLILTGSRSLAPVAASLVYVVAGYAPFLWAMVGISILAAAAMIPVSRHQPRKYASIA